MPVALISGFDAWGDLTANPAWLAVEAAEPELPPGWELRKVRLPVSWDRAFEDLQESWTDDVGLVIAFGVAPIEGIALEQIAINLTEGEDVDGRLPPGNHVIPDGPAAYWSTLPIDSLDQAMAGAGLPVSRSAHAGTFLCNFLFYQVMHHVLWIAPEVPAGFIHLSNLKGQAVIDQPALEKAVRVAVEAVATSVERTKPFDSGAA
jgi:pyroglutamyl-peptidase